MQAHDRPREDLDVAALTVAMIVAPGVYARNRMFAFFAAQAANEARERARMVRSLVLQMRRAGSKLAGLALSGDGPDRWTLSFAIPSMGFTRTVHVTREELAALRWVLSRDRPGGTSARPPDPALQATADDEMLVTAVLKKLA